jgi:hypothetical protein
VPIPWTRSAADTTARNHYARVTDRELVLAGTPYGPRLLRRAGLEQVLPDADLISLSATLRLDDELVASTGIETLNGDGLDDWWQDLADSFRGWEGEKTWESLEHDASLSARHDRTGHVTVRVTLRGPLGYEPDWGASATFAFDAGEELSRVASEVSEFMRD